MSRNRTFCRICEAACGLTVVRGPDGAPAGLRPDRDHPLSRGFVCAKGTRFLEVARDSTRITEPRLDGATVPWKRALGASSERLRRIIDEHGPHAVGIYFGNPLAFNTLGLVGVIALANAIGTRNLFYAGSQDCNNKFAASRLVYGSEFVHPIPDFANADLAVVFGSNPYVSQSSFVHLEGGSVSAFGGLVERGGHVVWVDPRRTESAAKWGEHLAIRPGADAWLMLGLLRLLAHRAPQHRNVSGLADVVAVARSVSLDEVASRTGLEREQILALATRIERSDKTVFHMSVGVNQSGFGTLAYALLQALSFVTGNLDQPGGVVFSRLSDAIDRISRFGKLDQRFESRIGGFASTLRTLPGGVLADEILSEGSERIRAMIVVAGDPLRSIPGGERLESAFEELDFLACIDMFESRTARHAHAFLPGTSWLERWDIATPSVPFTHSPLIQASGPVMKPVGSSRADATIVADLARGLGFKGAFWRALSTGLDRWLPAPGHGFPSLRSKPGAYLDGHPVRLWGPQLRAEAERLTAAPIPDGFLLVGRRRRIGHNSWLHDGTREARSQERAWLNPKDFAALGLEEGATIEVRSSAGAIELPVEARDGVAARTVIVPHGLPGANVNALLPSGPEHIERISGQHVMGGVDVTLSVVAETGENLEQTAAVPG